MSGFRKCDKAAALLRARIQAGELRPGMLAPSGPELAKDTGFAVMTCQKGLNLLVATGELARVSSTGRCQVPGDAPSGDGQLSRALAARRRSVGLTQKELADRIGMSVTAVGHAETARLWQSVVFWQKVDSTLNAGGDLVARYRAWREGSAPGEAEAAAESSSSADPYVLGGVVITLACDPAPVTVIFGDGSVATIQPAPA